MNTLNRNIDLDYVKHTATSRKIAPCEALFATLLSALAEEGLLTQGSVNYIARRMIPAFYTYLKVLGYLGNTSSQSNEIEKFRAILVSVNEALKLGDKVSLEKIDENTIRACFGGSTCRYCPKGVGLAEIQGSVCPFPRLLEGIAELEGVPVRLIHKPTVIKRVGELCCTEYRLGTAIK